MNWLHYLMEANLYLAVFYLCYCLFLNRETHYNLNRAYLLFSCVAAFILPVLQIGILRPAKHLIAANYPVPTVIQLPQATWAAPPPPPAKPVLTWDDALLYAYLIGAVIFLLVLIFKLYRLTRLAKMCTHSDDKNYRLVHLNEPNTAFSFFKYLFIGVNPQAADTIIRHELVHIRQKHSADILFIELLKVINWFNPFVYLLQRSLRTVHEYIADEQTASSGNGALAYSSFLVENAYGLCGTSVTHSFFNYNLLKKRIIMLHQKRSGKLARLKYLLTVPLCGGLLCASTLAFSKSYGFDLLPVKTDTSNTQRRYDVWNESSDKIFTTPKGYKVHERIIFINGAVSKTATIFDKNGKGTLYDDRMISAETTKSLYQKYGYQFPVDTIIKHKLPPPPPAPPTVNQLPPPPPPQAPHTKANIQFARPKNPSQVTSKGYKYAESGYLVDGKSDYRVIIVEKNGHKKDYWKSKASAADIKMLRDKYGYTFPTMPIYPKLPPPPPAQPVDDRKKPTPAAQGNQFALTLVPLKDETASTQPGHFSLGAGTGAYYPFLAMYDYIIPQVKANSHFDKNKDIGTVQTTFSINNNHSITDVKVVKNLNSTYDRASTIALSTYSGNLSNAKPGVYMLTCKYYNKPYGIEVGVKIDSLQSVTLLPPPVK